jgi:hypothetical protein
MSRGPLALTLIAGVAIAFPSLPGLPDAFAREGTVKGIPYLRGGK